MRSSPLQASYRAIFSEMLLAQSAAVNAFADIATRFVRVAEEQQAAARNNPPKAAAEPAHPGDGPETPGASLSRAANLGRALAGMPRVSMLVFLSHYDNLRRQRGMARD